MICIHLNNLQFRAHHGIYEEEKKSGNLFEVNAVIRISTESRIQHLHQTLDYVTAFDIIKERMNKPTPLLETVADEICEILHQYDSKITHIRIEIKKLNPPIAGFIGTIGISIEKSF